MKKIIFVFFLFVTLLSCSDDKNVDIRTSEGETQVDLNFLYSGTFAGGTTTSETELKEMTLLIFQGSGDDALFLYSRYAWKKTSANNTFTTTLKTGTDLTIYFVANSGTLIDDLSETILTEGKKWSDIRDHLVLSTPTNLGEKIDEKGLPMWGVLTGQIIKEEANAHLGTVELLRSVASIDVSIISNDFKLEKGHVVYAADKGYLPYNPDSVTRVNNILRAQGAWSPQDFTTGTDLKHTVGAGELSINNVFYVYENETPLTPPTGSVTRPTKVVLEGIWQGEGGSGKTTYYPLSIRNKDEATGEYVKKKVIRNNKYSIMVTKVNGDGYDDLDEAKDADDVNIDYGVVEWDENQDGEIMIDGSKYLYLASRTAQLYRNIGSAKDIVFKTNFSAGEIKMKFPSDADYSEGTINTHPRFKVDVLTNVGDSDNKYDCFRITTKQEYAQTNNPAVLTVAVGRIKFEITITQVDKDPTDWKEGDGIIVDL